MKEQSTTLQVRINPELKASAEAVLEELGMSTSQAVSIFLKQIVLTSSIPFRVGLPVPNAKTREAIAEIEAKIAGRLPAHGKTAEELFSDLGI
jgi:DNA-damage-inducible protein J